MDVFSSHEMKRLGYAKPAIEKGYANRTLHVNLSGPDIAVRPVAEQMKEVFVGGKGFDLWLLWHAVKGQHPVERPRERHLHRLRPPRRHAYLSRLRQEHRHLHLRHHRFRDGFQRGRLLRSLPQVLRVRCPGDPGQGERSDDHLHRRHRASRSISWRPRGCPSRPMRYSALLTDYFGRESRGTSPS